MFSFKNAPLRRNKKRACKRRADGSSHFAPENNQVLALRCAACAHAQALARGERMRRLTVDHSHESRRFPFRWRLECYLLLENCLDYAILLGVIRCSSQQREGDTAPFEAIRYQDDRSEGCKPPSFSGAMR